MPNPLFGVNWRQHRGTSLFSLGISQDTETIDYEEIPNGYKLTVTGTRGGQPYTWGYTALYDGVDHPVSGRPDVISIQAYKVNDNITLGFFKQNRIDGGAYARIVSADGNSLKG